MSAEKLHANVSAWTEQHAIEREDELEEGEIREGDQLESVVKLEELEEGEFREGDQPEYVVKLEESEIREGNRLENGIKLESGVELEESDIGKDEIQSTIVNIDGCTLTLPRTAGHPLYPRRYPNIFQFSALTINDLQE